MGQVVNVEKYKNSTAISKVADHNLRQQHSSNVDPSKSKNNLYLVGSADLDVLAEVSKRLEGIKYRKDANKVCNVVFSASNEEMSKIDAETWAKEINQYMELKVGKENVLYSVLHQDELTPHLHFSFVPIVDKKLRSNVYFDGPAKLSKFRQEIYLINKKYGFKKDQVEKKAKAKTIAKHYQEVNEFEKLDKKIEQEFQNLAEIPNFSMFSNPKKILEEKTPIFQNLIKFSKGLRVNFSKMVVKYKLLKKKNDDNEVKIQQLERRVSNLELRLENLGLSPEVSLKQCIQLKPTIAEVTAKAESSERANSSLSDTRGVDLEKVQNQSLRKKIKLG